MAFFRQPVGDLDQRDVPLRLDPAQHLGGMRLGPMTEPVAADGLGRNAAGAFVALIPANRRRDRNVELRRCHPP